MRTALFLSTIAVLVAAPALILAFLQGDGVATPEGWRVGLLVARAIATALVLTGGAAYLAHAYAVSSEHRRTLALCWLGATLCSAWLISPSIVAALPQSDIGRVLTSPAARWAWALAAVIGPDLVAGGAMLAAASARERRSSETEPLIVAPGHSFVSLGLAQLPAPPQASAPSQLDSAAQPAPSWRCDWCERNGFGSQQALNAHRGRCLQRPAPPTHG